MNTRDNLLAAHADGTLLEAVSVRDPKERQAVADALVNLHNAGEIDFLQACGTQELAGLSDHAFRSLRSVFCGTLPKVESSPTDAVSACARMSDRAGTDLSAGLIFLALGEWFEQSPSRAEDGLRLIQDDARNGPQLVRPVLFAGAANAPKKFTEEALKLSHHAQARIRHDALFALGQIAPQEDACLLKRTMARFGEVIADAASDLEVSRALESALHLFRRIGDGLAEGVEALLLKACARPTPALRTVLANGLQTGRKTYTDTMVNASLEALRSTDNQDTETIESIDFMLAEWDFDADRERVCDFLGRLLSHRDDAVDIGQLRHFNSTLGHAPGALLGWYLVSLLLTGDHRLCDTAFHLAPYQEVRPGLDIDLEPFALGPGWILYLARKVVGYCLLKRESASALLLSCLRSVSDEERAELEAFTMNHFLMNYPTAVDELETAVAEGDPAKASVARLAAAVRTYVDELSQLGACPAFAPGERARQLQNRQLTDLFRTAQEKAEEGSILSIVAHKATILYGSASITYRVRNNDERPKRKEAPFVAHEYRAEFPRLYAIDPVGLDYAIHCFRSEPPPE